MLARFCLYGFLKNQRYHEPFLVLALVEQGHSYLDVGLLIGFRELCVNLLEIPSGAIADLYGRRRAMIAAFVAYIAAFLLLASAPGLGLLFAAMGLYAVGEAFRSGTHKAMIFTWLKKQGREDEKAEVYGRTRSWSKRGSAVAALVAAAIAWMTGDFSGVLWFTAIPYTLGLINLATYPRWLDGEVSAAARRPLEVVRVTARAQDLFEQRQHAFGLKTGCRCLCSGKPAESDGQLENGQMEHCETNIHFLHLLNWALTGRTLQNSTRVLMTSNNSRNQT